MFYIVTYATDESKMKYLNCPSIQNICTTNIWGDYKDKLIALRNFILTKNPSDIICFVDAYDVICFSDPTEIITKFKEYNTDILFSAETSCFPWNHVSHLYPNVESLYKYLNSGSYIGYVESLLKILSLDMDQSPCDQGYLTYYYINHIHNKNASIKIKLDHKCILFQTAYAIPWSHFIIKKGRLYNQVMNTTPCFIHYNGRQHLMEDDTSIIPIVYHFIQDGEKHTFKKYKQKFPVICDENGILLQNTMKHNTTSLIHPNEKGDCDDDIIEIAKKNAAYYIVPDQDRIHKRDEVNYHSIIKQNQFITRTLQNTMNTEFAIVNRQIIETYFAQIGSKNTLLMDISLHDYVSIQMNNYKWPHSILGFSTHISDTHNIMLPDLYAMQNYKGALNRTISDNLPTIKKINKLFFIGVSSGKPSIEENYRIAMCRFAQDKNWIEAYISSVVNFTDEAAKGFASYMHPYISIKEQYAYRHIMVIDGNTACWDRLPWVLASKCVCWKQESDDQCWYYSFLKPWIHYIPFTLDTLEETWNKIKDDHKLQIQIVINANQFVEDFLRPRCHALYTRTLLDTIQDIYDSKL